MILWPGDTPRFNPEAFDDLLRWAAVDLKANELTLRSHHRVRVFVRNEWHYVTTGTVDDAALGQIIAKIYGDSGATEMKKVGGRDLDGRYDVKVNRGDTLPFRWNVTGILSRGRDGYEISIRVLDTKPPLPEDIGISADILEALNVDQGLVLVTGTTGSGKTTTLGALINHLLRNRRVGKIVSFEWPIELRYDGFEIEQAWVSQSEIGRHLATFLAAVRNLLRRFPHTVLIGELRDFETISATIEAALTGHLILGTTHTAGAAYAIDRLIRTYPDSRQSQAAYDLSNLLRIVVYQRLVPSLTDRGRVALREVLIFDPALREEMLDVPPNRMRSFLQDVIEKRGTGLVADAQRALDAKLISLETYREVVRTAPKPPNLKEAA